MTGAKRKRTTIHDIAREAGASTATVSRVLSDSAYPVSDLLRRKIRKAAEKLDYRPNIFSQILKGGINKTIGIVVPSITNPFYAQLVSDLERRCIAAGFASIICSSYDNPRLELNHLEILLRQQVGGIALCTINDSSAFIARLRTIPTPCVVFDQVPDGYQGDSVSFDFRKGGYMAARRLIESGCKRIVFATPAIDRASRRLRYLGYRDAIGEYGLSPFPELMIDAADKAGRESGGGEYRDGLALGRKILAVRRRPDAVMALNDIIAVGIMNTLAERGVRVPDDVSVIGFDDINFAAMVTPGLTTIRQDTDRTADLAAGMLFARIANPALPAVHFAVEPQLVERASVRVA